MKQEDKELIKKIKREIQRLPIDGRLLVVTVAGGSVYLRGRARVMRYAKRDNDIKALRTKLLNAVRRIKGVKQITDQVQWR